MKIWKVKEIISHVETEGWYFVAKRESHRQFKHLKKSGRVTVPGGLNDDLPSGTVKSILKQAGLI